MKRHLFWILPVVLAAVVLHFVVRPRSHTDDFERLMGSGRGSFEKGDFTNAVRYYQQAVKLAPESLDAHLNLANELLLTGRSESAVEECQRGSSRITCPLITNQAACTSEPTGRPTRRRSWPNTRSSWPSTPAHL